MTSFYLIRPMTDDPATAEKNWLEEQRERLQNAKCLHWSSLPLTDFILEREGSKRTDLSFVWNPPCGVISSRMLQILEPHFSQRFQIRHAVFAGKVVADRFIYNDANDVVPRGGKNSMCQRCPDCDQLIYDARGAYYLLRRDIPCSAIFGVSPTRFVVNEKLAARLLTQRWPKVSIKPISVKDRPTDGFPPDLTTITPEQERRLPPPRGYGAIDYTPNP